MLACMKLNCTWFTVNSQNILENNELDEFKRILKGLKPTAAVTIALNDKSPEIKLLNKMNIYKIVYLSSDGSLNYSESIFSGSSSNLHNEPKVNKYLYAISTSGTTGNSKIVFATVEAFVNRLNWYYSLYPYGQNEKSLKRVPSAFVDSIMEIFAPLLSKVLIVLTKDNKLLLDIVKLSEFAKFTQITRMTLLPQQLKLLILYGPKVWSSLKEIIISGDKLDKTLFNLFFQWNIKKQVRLLSLYGSTEVGGDVAFINLTESSTDIFNHGLFPIGKPISGVALSLVKTLENKVEEIVVSGQYFSKSITFETTTVNESINVFPMGDIGHKVDEFYYFV